MKPAKLKIGKDEDGCAKLIRCDKGCYKGYSRKIRHVRKSNWCILQITLER